MLIPKNHKGKQFHKKFLKFHYGAKHSHIEGNDHSYVASAGTCNGDSGGPVMIKKSWYAPWLDPWYQAGITSFGSRDCSFDKPAVFTKVSDHMWSQMVAAGP